MFTTRVGLRTCSCGLPISLYRAAPLNLRWTVRRSLSAVPQEGPAASETDRAEATMKRFWDKVGVGERDNSLTVTLDGRALKTPGGQTLLLPRNKPLLTSLIAAEWDHQQKLLKPHALPITSLAVRAIDAFVEKKTRGEVQEALLKYLDTDTICFHQDYPPQLERLQKEHWDPLLEWVRETYDVEIRKADSILFNTQPEATKEKLRKVISEFDHWEMAALERATYATKSFIIGLALVKRHLTVERASLASQVEVASQIERWGEVEDTHDVDYQDIRRQLASVACLLSDV